MNYETRAKRGLRRVSDNVVLAIDTQGFTAAPAFRQDLFLANRFGLTAATAAVIAELAFGHADHWNSTRRPH